MRARTGKIARLSEDVREALNRRLRDGQMGTELLGWLNGLSEVQAAMTLYFEGRAINEPNLTEWKQGGYEDWRRETEGKELMEELVAQTKALEGVSGDEMFADWTGALTVVALGQMLRRAMDEEPSPEQRRTVLGVTRQLAALRRQCHDKRKLYLEQQDSFEEQKIRGAWYVAKAELARQKIDLQYRQGGRR